MKKMLLFAGLLSLSATSFAQVTLTGTTYTQNFDGLGSGLPTGWRVYNGSSATSLGTLESLASSSTTGVVNDTACGASNVSSGGFKNYASANAIAQGTPCATQQTTADRAAGVRQVSKTNVSHPNLDSGAAFVLVLANTTGRTNFNFQFKLQSLDTSSPRVTKWIVDYGIGAAPTSFTPVTTSPATLTTGGNTFTNTSVSVNFGAALDRSASNVYIRVVTLEASTGTGNRASTAIDDAQLTWTNDPVAVANVNAAQVVPFQVLGAATSSVINFSYEANEDGAYQIAICDMTGRIVYNQTINVTNGVHIFSVNDANLSSGMYIAKISNGKTAATTKVMVH